MVRLAPGSLSPECPHSEGVTCQEKGREGGAKCKNLVLLQTRRHGWVGHSPAGEQDLGPQGERSAAAASRPRLQGISELETRRALWFVFLPWGGKGLETFPRIIAFLFKLKPTFP